MKISYVTTYKALDVHSWSGLSFYLAKALEAQSAELEYIGDLTMKGEKLLKIKRLLYKKTLGQRYHPGRALSVATGYADQVAARISPSSDCIFSPGSVPIARLATKKPKVFYTDATFAGMLDFYDTYSNTCPETIRKGHQLEQEALSSCALAIYSSDWAARTALDNYEVDPKKVKVVPFGANIECSRTFDDIKRLIAGRSRTTCRLLFLGVDWVRKGGDLAVETARALNAMGLRTELHIAGIKELPAGLPDYVVDHGFISKATPEGRAAIQQLIAKSHFLILPTRAEAYGVVFCEANSFGVPNIATITGGIPTIVKDDVNGRLFPLSAPAADYAAYISRLFSNYDEYERMALASFEEFQQRLNWTVSGKKLIELMREL